MLKNTNLILTALTPEQESDISGGTGKPPCGKPPYGKAWGHKKNKCHKKPKC